MIESIIAFLLVLFITSVIYVLSKRLMVNVSLYKYLIFFVILDSPALILAFAALALEIISPFALLIYLGIILAADALLLGGF